LGIVVQKAHPGVLETGDKVDLGRRRRADKWLHFSKSQKAIRLYAFIPIG